MLPARLLLWFAFILAVSCEYPPGPTPYCSSRQILPLLPLAISEVITVDVSDYFSGYNIDIILQPNNFSYLRPKYNKQAENKTKLDTPISMELKHSGNAWSSDFTMLTKSGFATYLHYGRMHSRQGVPTITKTVLVENRTDMDCLSAVSLSDFGGVVVDCVNYNSSLLNNVLVVVDMASGQLVRNYSNPSFERFRKMSRRTLLSYHDTQSGYNYLVRAHLGDGVDPEHSDNTYIELFLVDSEFDFDLVALLDRTFLGNLKLRVMDVKLYRGQLFFLDWNSGLYRVAITSSQIIKPQAFYVGQFFSRFDVYSDNMDDQLLVALANQHAIYEVNWDLSSDPKLLAKYSLVQNSSVRQVLVNREFVVVQAAGEAVVLEQFTAMLNYTWVFSRGSRTYTNAYKVFGHPTEDVLVEMDAAGNYLLLANSQGIENYEVARPILTIQQTDEAALGAQAKLALFSTSSDPLNPNVVYCVQQVEVVFVAATNMSLWPTIKKPIETMYVNYPGQLVIDLDKYALGPNISYAFLSLSLHEGADWVLKQNQTKLVFHPTYGQINFLHTDVVSQYGNNTILLYCQDEQNNTYVSMCINEWQTVNVNCTVLSHYQHRSRLNALATAFVQGSFQLNYVYIMNLEGSRNNISLFWFSTSQRYGSISYPDDLTGEVGGLAVSNGILFVTLPKIKQIDAYYLSACDGTTCPLGFSLTVETVRKLGVEYFAPRRVRTTREHPEVIFVECLDSVLVLDVDNPRNVVLLKQLITQSTQTTKFQLAVNKEFLVVVSPARIEEHRMTDLYKGHVVFHKLLPLYHYTLASPFDLEFNDAGNLFYLTATDNRYNKPVVLVYRLGSTLVNSLYDVIGMNSSSISPVELEVSGGYVDFVTLVQDGRFTIVKQYEKPQMVVENEFHDLQFLIEAKNTIDTEQVDRITAKVSNYPDNFNRSRAFPTSTATYFTEKIDKRYTWSDRDWFRGHILNYYYKCEQCPGKLRFESHLLEESQLELQAEDFHRSQSGGYVLWQDVFRLHANGTVRSIETLPKPNAAKDESCKRVFSDSSNLFVVAACINSYQEVHIYLTSYVSRKGFTMGPWKTASSYVANLEIVSGIMILVDVSPLPSSRVRSGGVFVYAISLDSIADEKFVELDYIDTNDLSAAHGWQATQDVFVGNAHLVYSGEAACYRLFITEVDHGLFIVSFNWQKGYSEISIRSVDYIDLNQVLNQKGFHLPNDATFTAVTHLRVIQSQHFEIDSVAVICSNYHTFEFNVIYQSDGRLQACILTKVYYRYAYYRTYNLAKAYNGFLAVPYTIPPIQEYMSNFSRQVVGLYDTVDYPEDDVAKGYRERFILAGHVLDTVTATSFDFNATRGSDLLGLVVIDPKNKIISENRISKNLSIVVSDPLYKTQNMYLWPYSDFYKLMFQLRIVGEPDHSLTWWQILLIVLGSILAGIGLFFGGRWVIKKWKLSRKKTYLLEEDAGDEELEEEQTVNGAINASVRDSAQTTTLEQPLLQQEQQENSISKAKREVSPVPEVVPAMAANHIQQDVATKPPVEETNVAHQQLPASIVEESQATNEVAPTVPPEEAPAQ